MKKIIISILALFLIFCSGQLVAQKTNDHGASKERKEQKKLNNNTKDKTNDKGSKKRGKSNDRGGSKKAKEQTIKDNTKPPVKPIIDDKAKKDKEKAEKEQRERKEKERKERERKERKEREKKKQKTVDNDKDLSPAEKIQKVESSIKKAKEKIAKAYAKIERQKANGKISAKEYMEKKAKLSALETALDKVEKQKAKLEPIK